MPGAARDFYQGKAWRRLSKAFMLSRYYICERCGRPAEICHHKTHITPANIHDPAITINPANLEALCLQCHNTEHFGHGGAVVPGLAFDESGDLILKGGKQNEVHDPCPAGPGGTAQAGC